MDDGIGVLRKITTQKKTGNRGESWSPTLWGDTTHKEGMRLLKTNSNM